MLSSFFVTYKMKDESISIRFLTKYSFFERSIIDFVISISQNTLHSSNALFIHSLMCLLTL